MTANSGAIQKILTDFQNRGWDSRPMEATLELVIGSPETALMLLSSALGQVPKGATFLDAALSFIPDEAFPELVALALDTFSDDGKNQLSQDIILHASLQSLLSLHPHLDIIFEQAPNSGKYYEFWPWRDSGQTHLGYLSDLLEQNQDPRTRFRAWNALLETRHPETFQFLIETAERVGMRGRHDAYILHVGYETNESNFRRLSTYPVYHIFFPGNYIPAAKGPKRKWRNLLREHHPTWVLPDEHTPPMNFGGMSGNSCACCGGGLHHFISLQPIPDTLEITGLDRLEMASCLTCLGWEQNILFYEHDGDGQPNQTGFNGPQTKPKVTHQAFPPTQVHLAHLPPRWHWQNDATSNNSENLNRVGGYPTWIQNADYPRCPWCMKHMPFLLQLTSGLPTNKGEEWDWGDSGICFAFWCDGCKISGFRWQAY